MTIDNNWYVDDDGEDFLDEDDDDDELDLDWCETCGDYHSYDWGDDPDAADYYNDDYEEDFDD